MAARLTRRAFWHLRDADQPSATATEVCTAIVRALHQVTAFEHCALMHVDPTTMLPAGGVVEGFPPEACGPFWDSELLDPDFAKFNELARRSDPVVSLYEEVDGDLTRSVRYRKLYEPLGASDELRIAFVAGTSCLAVGAFLRPAGAGPVTPEELDAVRELVPHGTAMLRRALGRLVHDVDNEAPVVIMLDADDRILGITGGGGELLNDLRTQDVDEGPLPGIVRVAAQHARRSGHTRSLTTRVRGRSGRWLRIHVSPMEGVSGGVAITATTAPPWDLVPLLLESYGLTERETEVVLLLCRGRSTKEIAAELIISPHTVRDHVKVIYEKAEVNSRGELVAQLFTGHLLERLHSTVAAVA